MLFQRVYCMYCNTTICVKTMVCDVGVLFVKYVLYCENVCMCCYNKVLVTLVLQVQLAHRTSKSVRLCTTARQFENFFETVFSSVDCRC